MRSASLFSSSSSPLSSPHHCLHLGLHLALQAGEASFESVICAEVAVRQRRGDGALAAGDVYYCVKALPPERLVEPRGEDLGAIRLRGFIHYLRLYDNRRDGAVVAQHPRDAAAAA